EVTMALTPTGPQASQTGAPPSPVAPLAPMTGASQLDRMFPVLTPEQIRRIAAHGRRRRTAAGEILVEPDALVVPFFVVTGGEVQVFRPSLEGEVLVAVHRPGQFSGDVVILSGRRSLVGQRVSQSGEVLELDRDRLLSLVQTDSEISELIMRAFILRRVELIA